MSEDPVPQQDGEILRRVIGGDVELFRLLIERHQDTLFRLIVKQVGDDSLAEDLVQESFIRAFKGLKNFRVEASFKTWITRIALNVTNTYFTSRSYKQRLAQVTLDSERHDQPIEEYDLSAERDLKRLQIAIGHLSEKYRSVVALCVLGGKSYQEAGEILGVPAGTVGSRIHKALALLHTEFWKIA